MGNLTLENKILDLLTEALRQGGGKGEQREAVHLAAKSLARLIGDSYHCVDQLCKFS